MNVAINIIRAQNIDFVPEDEIMVLITQKPPLNTYADVSIGKWS